MNTPLFDALKKLATEDSTHFHMPGHKSRNMPYNWTELIPQIDTSEVFGMDNLLDHNGVIKSSLENVAKVYGAKYSIYSVNGSTGSIHVALSTCTMPGDTILVQRNCHKAVYNSMILNRLNPYYIYPNYNENNHLITGINPGEIDKIMSENDNIKVVMLTSPNYYGICHNLEEIADIVHAHNGILIVDEAHGSHFRFSDKMPKSAIESGADIVIQSTHKTLPSFTQTSIIHIGGDRIDIAKLKDRFQLYMSTSPSYLFQVSCEAAVAFMDSDEGRAKLDSNIDYCYDIIEKLKAIEGVSVFTGDDEDKSLYAKDETKILFKVDGISGAELKSLLYERHNIRLEMCDNYYALALVSVMNEKEDYDKLVEAVRDIAKNVTKTSVRAIEIDMPKPVIGMPIYEAYLGERELVALNYSVGKISALQIIPYPPGIPLVASGEIITEEMYNYLLYIIRNGLNVVGLFENGTKIMVVKK